MTYDFFAAKADKIDVLNFIFEETDLQIFDLSSPYGQKVSEYKSIGEIAAKFNLHEETFGLTFQMWSPGFKVEPIFEKVDLNSKKCQGHTFRYSTVGWGLIQLYFGGADTSFNLKYLHRSHIGHFNQKGALARHNLPSNSYMGDANKWNWPEIEKTSRKLKYQIHNKLAVKKMGSNGVLKGAEILEGQGFALG